MASYLIEAFDRLPFGDPDKARRYATERYQGAVGLNWYDCDPTLRFLMRRYLGDGFGWAEPRLREMGALMGGPIAELAEAFRAFDADDGASVAVLRGDRMSVLDAEGLAEDTAIAVEYRHGTGSPEAAVRGAARFAAGRGRHGDFSDIRANGDH